MPYVIGIDASTTATKAVLIDEAGAVAAIAASEYGFEQPRPLWSEQSPDLWWVGTTDAIRRVLADGAVDPASVAAVGLTGQMHGLVLLDGAGDVLRPAILWNDQRTGAECDAIRTALGPERLVAITGDPGSRLGRAADVVLSLGPMDEACPKCGKHNPHRETR